MSTPEEKAHTEEGTRPQPESPAQPRRRPDSRRPDLRRERPAPAPADARRDEVDAGGRTRTWWEKNATFFYIAGVFGAIVLLGIAKSTCL